MDDGALVPVQNTYRNIEFQFRNAQLMFRNCLILESLTLKNTGFGGLAKGGVRVGVEPVRLRVRASRESPRVRVRVAPNSPAVPLGVVLFSPAGLYPLANRCRIRANPVRCEPVRVASRHHRKIYTVTLG